MKTETKVIISVIAIIGFIIYIYAFKGKPKKPEKSKADIIQATAELKELSYRKEAVLLAMKYKVNEDVVFLILSDTDIAGSDDKFDDNLDFLLGKTTREVILKMSDKYKIPPEIIASMYIDFYSIKKE